LEDSDLDAYRAIRAKPHLHTFMPGGAAGAVEADRRARKLIRDWSAAAWQSGPHAYAPWAVVEKASSRLVGHLGLRHLDEIAATEILYLLDDSVHGRGYATEGVDAALAFARSSLQLKRVVALAAPENWRSIRVMERAGMRRVGQRHIFGLDAVEYEIHLV
jgi:ribosomal-protein-alanine N-acetyltransferase